MTSPGRPGKGLSSLGVERCFASSWGRGGHVEYFGFCGNATIHVAHNVTVTNDHLIQKHRHQRQATRPDLARTTRQAGRRRRTPQLSTARRNQQSKVLTFCAIHTKHIAYTMSMPPPTLLPLRMCPTSGPQQINRVTARRANTFDSEACCRKH